MTPSDPKQLCRHLGYTFVDARLLEQALRHSSFANEQPGDPLQSNERLEFLGDAVINLVVGHLLMEENPTLPEGALSRMRAALVNEKRLAAIARSIQLGDHITLGKGERQGMGQKKNSILSDALEALIAAVYMDGGFEVAFAVAAGLFAGALKDLFEKAVNQDFKTQLQEMVQDGSRRVPEYSVVGEQGPDHEKTFQVQLRVRGQTVEGAGRSKKIAEQDAARKALEILDPS
ncbi:MAG: ribonuclease III [Desulfobacterales bacterium]|nr:ribonuclease III [Desulfobacterales bacterium]